MVSIFFFSTWKLKQTLLATDKRKGDFPGEALSLTISALHVSGSFLCSDLI